ncbi:hypothetical protein ACP4OV_029032 [Aristida adscensionis]
MPNKMKLNHATLCCLFLVFILHTDHTSAKIQPQGLHPDKAFDPILQRMDLQGRVLGGVQNDPHQSQRTQVSQGGVQGHLYVYSVSKVASC